MADSNNAVRDGNFVPTALGQSSTNPALTVPFQVDPVTGRLKTDSAGGAGTVTSVSVVSANGFAGSVATSTTTPAITISTTVTGLVKGNGTALSAAVANTDYQIPVLLTTTGTSGAATFNGTTLNIPNYGGVASNITVGTTTITSGTTTRILYDNAGVLGEYTLTGSGTVVAMQTAPTFATSITTPSVLATANDSGAIGASGTAFADLFLASGAVINFAAGDITLTHSADKLTFGGGVFSLNGNNIESVGILGLTGTRVTKGWFTDIESTNMPTVGGTALLTSLTAPQFTTIELGAASDTTLSRSSAGVLAVEGVVVDTISATNTLTNKRITRRSASTAGPGATPTTNTDNVDVQIFTALATAITSMTTNLSGTPSTGDRLEFWLTDNGTARAITWGASFAATTVGLPTTTVISTRLRVYFEWSGSTWDCVGVC